MGIFSSFDHMAAAKAQRYLSDAEEQAGMLKRLPEGTVARRIGQVAIVGAGTMGGGIAMNFLNAGIPVTIIDTSEEGLDRGISGIRRNYEISVARGRLGQAEVEGRLALLSGATQIEAVAQADLVIEAVFEDLEVKQEVFREIDAIARPGAILATNTSTLDIDAIARVTDRPADVIGLHFFSPANVMRLVEIIQASATAPDAVLTALEMCRMIGKIGVVVGVCYGFVGNRMLEPYGREAHRLLLEGATPEQIDSALTSFGMKMGPLAMYDMAGIDIGALIRKENRAAIAHDPSYCLIGDILADRGEYGQKSGKGFYSYQGRERLPRDDLQSLTSHAAASLGIEQRTISGDEILERCLLSLIDEGIRILDEGIAQRPGDIDVIWCNGYGFPHDRGGPMYWADSIGLRTVERRLQHYRETLREYGAAWFTPSPALQRISEGGQSLIDFFPNT